MEKQNERDCKGRFQKGNKEGKGNPYNKAINRFRTALFGAVTPEDFTKIVETLKEQALSGDLKAITILLDRLLGAPVTIDVMERLAGNNGQPEEQKIVDRFTLKIENN